MKYFIVLRTGKGIKANYHIVRVNLEIPNKHLSDNDKDVIISDENLELRVFASSQQLDYAKHIAAMLNASNGIENLPTNPLGTWVSLPLSLRRRHVSDVEVLHYTSITTDEEAKLVP